MPSKSAKQARMMAAAAHNPAFAKKVGVPVSVAKEFNQADKGRKFGSGGMTEHDDVKEDKALIKKAFRQHETAEHGGKHVPLHLKKGGKAEKWIQGAIKHKGSLHKALHVPAGEKIPAKKLAKAAKAPGKLGQRARLAKTLRGFD